MNRFSAPRVRLCPWKGGPRPGRLKGGGYGAVTAGLKAAAAATTAAGTDPPTRAPPPGGPKGAPGPARIRCRRSNKERTCGCLQSVAVVHKTAVWALHFFFTETTNRFTFSPRTSLPGSSGILPTSQNLSCARIFWEKVGGLRGLFCGARAGRGGAGRHPGGGAEEGEGRREGGKESARGGGHGVPLRRRQLQRRWERAARVGAGRWGHSAVCERDRVRSTPQLDEKKNSTPGFETLFVS